MLDDRKLAVLRAIVEDYVSTNEPVGSKALVDRHNLGVSPATIRNDMAVLEEQGYIAQPHTSAGRIPTDKGYRLFVDRLSTIKPLSPAERRAIETFLAGAYDLDDVVSRTVRLLAQLTRQVAVVQYPSLTRFVGPARRTGAAGPAAAAVRPDHQHRPGRAAGDRDARGDLGGLDRAPAGVAEHRAWTGAGWPTCPARSSRCRRRWPRTNVRSRRRYCRYCWRPSSRSTKRKIVFAGAANLAGADFVPEPP